MTTTEDALKLALECERLRDFHDGKNQYLATVSGLREAARVLRALVAERDEWQAACARAQENADHWTAEAARYAAESRLARDVLTAAATAPSPPEQRS